jgi:hypothetical protein
MGTFLETEITAGIAKDGGSSEFHTDTPKA